MKEVRIRVKNPSYGVCLIGRIGKLVRGDATITTHVVGFLCQLKNMNYLYWIAVFMSVVTYGNLSVNNYKQGLNGISYWSWAFFYVSAIFLSGKVFASWEAIVITAVAILLGNMLFWDVTWNVLRRVCNWY